VRELVFALDAAAAGQQQGRQLARQAALRGKRVAGLPAAAYAGWKDASEESVAGALTVGGWQTTLRGEELAVPEGRCEDWDEQVTIMVADGGHTKHGCYAPRGGGSQRLALSAPQGA
jgi:hypothetical protein